MKILVLGGNRYFGKTLVSLLLARGDHVTVLNRGSRDDGFGDRIMRVKCDRTDVRDLRLAVGAEDWDVIYDQICYDAGEAEAACKIFAGKVGHYIFTSTKSVYGYGENLSEEAFDPYTYKFLKRETLQSDYGEAKRQAEAIFFQARAFPVTAVRFPIVLGPRDYTRRLVFHVEHVLHHQAIYFPNLDARTCFVHADDASEVLYRLSEMKPPVLGPLNVCSPDSISFHELVAMLEENLEVKVILAKDASSGEVSPFGLVRSCYLNTARLQLLGIQLEPITQLLPRLIRASFTA